MSNNFTNDKWILNSAKVVGRSHRLATPEIPCQDYVVTSNKNNIVSLVLSDGCGSAPFAKQGAKIISLFLEDYITKKFDKLYSLDEIKLKKTILTECIKVLSGFYQKNKNHFNSYLESHLEEKQHFYQIYNNDERCDIFYPITLLNATIQFVILKDNKALIGRIGDGFITCVKNGALSILSYEEKGLNDENITCYPSEVYFNYLISNNTQSLDLFDVIKIDDCSEYSGFMIFSDGIVDKVIDVEYYQNTLTNEIELIKYCPIQDEFKLIYQEKKLQNILLEYQNDKSIRDDLSVCLMKKDNIQIYNVNNINYNLITRAREEDTRNKNTVENSTSVASSTPKEHSSADITNLPSFESLRLDYPVSLYKYVDLINRCLEKKGKYSFDEIYSISQKENIDLEYCDLKQMMIYQNKISTFSINEQTQVIELRKKGLNEL